MSRKTTSHFKIFGFIFEFGRVQKHLTDSPVAIYGCMCIVIDIQVYFVCLCVFDHAGRKEGPKLSASKLSRLEGVKEQKHNQQLGCV